MEPEILRPKSNGLSGILELARMVTPPGHVTLGFQDENGVFYSVEQLKAIEGQEQEMKKANSLDGNT